ncbi:MAG: HD-GYP domain-containing protein [Firmicutes bacterium]|jgi:putative nucleotidyltransferase with HDIG domain|nr:HD-GYP domain-containing protein [Bacillota bacterium]
MYPKSMSWFIALVAGIAAALAIQTLFVPTTFALGIVILAIGNEIGAFGSLTLLRGHGEVSVDLPILVAIAIIFGPVFGFWVGLLATWTRRELNREIQWPSTLFNHAQFAIIGWISGYAFFLLRGNVLAKPLIYNTLPLIITVTLAFLLNVTFVIVAIALRKHRSLQEVFRVYYKSMTPSFILMLPVAFLMAGLYKTLGVWGELAFFVPLVGIRWTMTLIKALRQAYFNTIRVMLASLDAKDPYTYGHSMRVGHYGMLLAQHMEMPEDKVEGVRFAGMLHDIGKMGTPEHILNKPGRLNMDEILIMQRHPIVGSAILAQIQMQGCAAKGVLHHHERWDGTGYPDNLRGEEIPVETRIISVVDAYDAMTSDRPYRRAMPHEAAIAEIRAGSGIQFDPTIVDKFLALAEHNDLSRTEGSSHGWDMTPSFFSRLLRKGTTQSG